VIIKGRYRCPSFKALTTLALLAFLISGLGRPVAEAQRPELVEGWQLNSPDTLFPTETEENFVTGTHNPLTPTVTPFPTTPTKYEGGGVGGLGVVRQFYLPLVRQSDELILPTPTTTPLPTLTAPPAPPATLSRYMSTANIDSTNYNDLYTLGRQRGGCDGSPTPAQPNSFLILAFGYPWRDTITSPALNYWVSLYPDGVVKARLDALESSIFGFVRGYYNCVSVHNPTASLTVGLGINGSIGNWLTYEHGRQWALMVSRLNNQYSAWQSTIKVVGAADFEPGWINTPVANVRQWAEGYASVANSQYYFYGSCDGCPAITRDASGNYVAGYAPVLVPNSNWTMDDVWYLAYGIRPAYPLPEIYATNGFHARQWQNIAYWAATCTLIPYTTTPCEPQRRGINRYMYFSGAMTQHQACIDKEYDPACYPLLFNEPPVGWGQLWQALNDPNTPLTHQAALKWSTDITWNQ
jgi:hypothetical protein